MQRKIIQPLWREQKESLLKKQEQDVLFEKNKQGSATQKLFPFIQQQFAFFKLINNIIFFDHLLLIWCKLFPVEFSV